MPDLEKIRSFLGLDKIKAHDDADSPETLTDYIS
jgi:hypothetical protein